MSSSQQDLTQWRSVPAPTPTTFTGRFVTLEPLSASRHAHAIWEAVVRRDEVWQWLGDGPYTSETDLALALAAKETGAAARFFAIVPADTAVAKGYASLMRFDPANGVIEVGNVLFSPALQRTAAATETIYLLARYIFEDLGYRRFEWKCNASNLPSRRAAERFGFAFEGVFRQHMVIKGQNRDTAWYAMIDSEWRDRQRAFEAWLAPDNFDAEGKQRQALSCFQR